MCRQIPRNISLQLVASAQFSSEQLVLSTFWQTGVVFRVAVATDTVIWARNVNAGGEVWKAVMWSFYAFIDIFNIEKNNGSCSSFDLNSTFNYYYNPVHSLSCGFELFKVEPPYASIPRKLDQLRHYQSPIQNTQIFSFKDL